MNFLKLNQNNINPIQFLYTASKSLEVKPLLNKQTCEDLSAYNPPTTPATIRDLSNKAELRHLIQVLIKNNNTLKKENQELTNGLNQIIEINRDLYNSDKKYEDLWTELSKNQHMQVNNFICLSHESIKLYDEISITESKITILQSLNDKYTNENKLLENEIEKM